MYIYRGLISNSSWHGIWAVWNTPFHFQFVTQLEMKGILDPASWNQDPGSRILDPGSWTLDSGSRIQDQGSWILNLGCWIHVE